MNFLCFRMKCIDTHIHIWDLDRVEYTWLNGNTTILNRNYLINELEPQLKRSSVVEGVLVQAANTQLETDYMLEVAAQNSWLKGVVGWLPLMEPEQVAEILSSGYGKQPLFKGVRHLIHDEPDTNWLLQSPVLESLQLLAQSNIPYDVVGVLPGHLEAVLKVLHKVPELRVVLDHLSQPPIRQNEKFGRWGELISEIAKLPGAYAKISGLGTTSGKGINWDANDIHHYVAFALENFGPTRCFCGGDWPVALLSGSYQQAWTNYQQTLDSLLDKNEAAKVLYSNAKQFYQL